MKINKMFGGRKTMAKKFGKVLLATALIGTAAAGTYYYLKKKKEEESFDFDSEDGEEKATRNYVPLNFEKAGEKVTVFVSKAGDVLEKTVDMVKQKVSGTSTETEDDYLDEGDEDFDVESLDLDDETPVEVVEDILSDDTDTQ